ncbi:solute carrier family 2, facilitated glucose transporter member 3-like [Paramacrobiotus metropolitanus]|uniref:solute carrier family 2, facilitated glucose transporter member 3-like n=1 Tax=Paramacrobiotus metropolitanus TaxID=2943436 RepID=UPI002445F727|nr:solute carrier family 2, facilitated glucose transporter member 3-like [Paramacrobiotus metropolitanus]
MPARRRHSLLAAAEPVCIPLNESFPESPLNELLPSSQPPTSGLTRTLVLAVVTVTFGTWFPMGYSIAAMNGPQSVILDWIRQVKCQRVGSLDVAERNTSRWCGPPAEDLLQDLPELRLIWAVLSSAFMVGGFVSTFLAAGLIDRFGLKRTILINSGVFILGNSLICLAEVSSAYELITAGRFIIGFSLGISCVAPPIYCSEITPTNLRGTFGVLPVVMNVAGMIVATVLGLPVLLGNAGGWTALNAFCFISQIALLLVFPMCPESPRRLYLTVDDREAAHHVLHWLRRSSVLVRSDMKELEAERETHLPEPVGLVQLLREPYFRSVLKICVTAMLAQQLSGFSCVSFYSTAIFTDVGLTRRTSIYASIGVWCVFLTFALLCMALIDRVGRRILLLVSHTGMIVALMGFVLSLNLPHTGDYAWVRFLPAACIPLYIAFYALGSNSIPYILPAEMFGQEARAAAMTWVSAVSWGAAVVTTLMFPLVNALTKEYTFLFFVASVVAATWYLLFKLPETKGRTIEEVQGVLRRQLAGHTTSG